MSSNASPLRLADGIIFNVGMYESRLIDLKGGRRTLAPSDLVGPLGAIVAGVGPETTAPLAADGYLVPGEPGVDPFLRERLAELDAATPTLMLVSQAGAVGRAYDAVLEAHASRKVFWGGVGQCPVLPETALRRALLVGGAKRRVLCFGDDDLVSLALAALGHEVTVLDVDPQLLELIDGCAKARGLGVRTRRYDARDPVPVELGRFDCFVSDPMSNRACFELFVSRALALLAPGGDGFVAVHPAAATLFTEIAAFLRLEITAWHRKHNRYYGTGFQHDRYQSDWVAVRKTPETRPAIAGDALAAPASLYAEDVARQVPALLSFYGAIDEPRFLRPFFLEPLVRTFADSAGLELRGLTTDLGPDWCLIDGRTSTGRLLVHADARRRELTVKVEPFSSEAEEAVRGIFLAAYKRELAERAHVSVDAHFWDLRVI
jgi:hypothetical protein